MPPRNSSTDSALQELRETPNANVYKIAKKHEVKYKTLSSAWSRIKDAKVEPKQFFSLSKLEMDSLCEDIKNV